MVPTESRAFKPVSRKAPCLICGKPDWCRRSADDGHECHRSGAPVGSVVEGLRCVALTREGFRVFRAADERPAGNNGRHHANGNGRHAGSGPRPWPTAEAAAAALAKAAGGDLEAIYDWAPDWKRARIRLAAGGKTFRELTRGAGGWLARGPSKPHPLYRVAELPPDGLVFICEGEKATDAAWSIGLVATTSGGKSSAGGADWRPLSGRDCVILPDNDKAGREYAVTVAEALAALNPPARVRICELPGLPAGGDIVEFVGARDSREDEEIRAELLGLIERAAMQERAAPAGPGDGFGPQVVCFADIEPRPIRWLWPGRIPLGRMTLLVGRPGAGKTFLCAAIASVVSRGATWPDGHPCERGSVIVVCSEDDRHDTLRPRLDAADADVRRVYHFATVARPGENGERCEELYRLDDVASLERVLQSHRDVKLIVVDPVGSFIGGRTDAHRDNEVRAVLAPVAKLAETYGAALLVVAHPRKSAADHADDTALGSRAFSGLARAVWHLTPDPHDDRRRLLLPGKTNLSEKASGLAFVICGTPAAVAFERDPVAMSADDAIAAERAARGPEPDRRSAAADWLADQLQHGPVPAGALKRDATEAGFVWKTVQRAADELDIRRHKGGFGTGWVWSLPKGTRRGHEGDTSKNLSSCPLRENPVENTHSSKFHSEGDKFLPLVPFEGDGQPEGGNQWA